MDGLGFAKAPFRAHENIMEGVSSLVHKKEEDEEEARRRLGLSDL